MKIKAWLLEDVDSGMSRIKTFFVYWIFLPCILLFPFVLTFFLDRLIKPEMNSIEDEGIYFGMLVISVAVEIGLMWVVVHTVLGIQWIISKLK